MPSRSSPPSPPPGGRRRRPRDPEYVAVILAATRGTRLFPLTSSDDDGGGVPKHLLPVSPLNPGGGVGGGGGGGGMSTPLGRLLSRVHGAGFDVVVVAVHADDDATVPYLLGGGDAPGGGFDVAAAGIASGTGMCATIETENGDHDDDGGGGEGEDPAVVVTDLEYSGSPAMLVRVARLPPDCHGSADALRFLSRDDALPRTSHAVVMPGDLMLEGDLANDAAVAGGGDGGRSGNVLSSLVEAHRTWNARGGEGGGAACTMVFADVGAEDGNGAPLKESSKAKMGLLSRSEEDAEYVGLSSEVPPPSSGSLASPSYSRTSSASASAPSRRVVLKRSKLDVEEDEGTGSTPKLVVPRRRLHAAGADVRGGGRRRGGGGGRRSPPLVATSDTDSVDRSPSISLRTDLLDLHLYAISNWVFRLMHARPKMQSFQAEVLPLLISRQYRGVEAAFGPTAWRDESNRERLRGVLREMDGVVVVPEDGGCGGGGGGGGGGWDVESSRDKVSTLLGMYASGRASGGLGAFVPDGGISPAGGGDGGGDEADPPASASGADASSGPSFPASRHRFAVSAQVLSRGASSLTLRACTIPSLLYGCGEVTSRILKLDPDAAASLVAPGARLSTKFNSILMPGCTLGEKVQTKSCTIGRDVVLGDKAKLNNVVVMDGATIGPNTVLQQCFVGANARIGANCNLKDCQVGPGASVPAGTRSTEKGEAFHA